jgi:NADPH-dependent glutamate synthase beta subunit-like oxidoreductase
MAIVGSGPSGFYTAKYLLEQNDRIHIDLYEKLPFPFGLVRYGVAPDHPEVKTVTNTFEEVFSKHKGRIRYFGNITIGEKQLASQSVPFKKLLNSYSSVILAYGAHSDYGLDLPNEDKFSGILSSREFVNWYNGHPDYIDLHNSHHFKDKEGNFRTIRNIVIIGNGNVALDCARIVMKDIKELAKTDLTKYSLDWIEKIQSSLEKVYVVGRRGHIQAAFTIKELRELSKLSMTSHPEKFIPLHFPPNELALGSNASSLKEIENNRPKKRILELIDNISKSYPNSSSGKQIEMRFLLTPIHLQSTNNNEISSVEFQRNELNGEPSHQKAVPVNPCETVVFPCDLLIKAIGYKSISIDPIIPFNSKTNTVLNDGGLALFPPELSSFQDKLYVTGWLKRGPTGIILSNIIDAKETTAKILNSIKKGSISIASSDPVISLKDADPSIFENVLNWEEVQHLNQLELEKGAEAKKIREKFVRISEMIAVGKAKN